MVGEYRPRQNQCQIALGGRDVVISPIVVSTRKDIFHRNALGRTGDHPNTIKDMADTISASLANIVLPAADGGEIRLGSLWEKDPALIVFLRHYG